MRASVTERVSEKELKNRRPMAAYGSGRNVDLSSLFYVNLSDLIKIMSSKCHKNVVKGNHVKI